MCREHDGLTDPDTGKPYTYAGRKDGKNFPPLHPWCRSCTAPVVDERTLEGLTRPAEDPVYGGVMEVPASMTYKEWNAKYVDGDPDAMLNEKMAKRTGADQQQLNRYRKVLGDECPETLAEFQRIKYTEPEKWRLTKGYLSAVQKGDISALVGLSQYIKKAEEVNRELVGLETLSGVKISGYETHFIDRLIGQTDATHKGMRAGVPVADAKETILFGQCAPTAKRADGKESVSITGKRCKVTVNPSNGMLIQTNPKK